MNRLLYPFFSHSTYCDASYLNYEDLSPLKYFTGSLMQWNRIKRNEEYFSLPLEILSTINDVSNQSLIDQLPTQNCTYLSIPPFIYFQFGHAIQTFSSHFSYNCYYIINSNVRYIDLSMWYCGIVFNSVIYGLEKLTVLKAGSVSLYEINWTSLKYRPSLRKLHLEGNFFGLGTLKPFPHVPKLEELDFSNNSVDAFSRNMFDKLTSHW